MSFEDQMTKIRSSDRDFARTISQIIDSNPFLPARPRLERQALGQSFVKEEADWNLHPLAYRASENTIRLQEKAETVLERLRLAIESVGKIEAETAAFYTDLAHFVLFGRYRDDMQRRLTSDFKRILQSYSGLGQCPLRLSMSQRISLRCCTKSIALFTIFLTA